MFPSKPGPAYHLTSGPAPQERLPRGPAQLASSPRSKLRMLLLRPSYQSGQPCACSGSHFPHLGVIRWKYLLVVMYLPISSLELVFLHPPPTQNTSMRWFSSSRPGCSPAGPGCSCADSRARGGAPRTTSVRGTVTVLVEHWVHCLAVEEWALSLWGGAHGLRGPEQRPTSCHCQNSGL